MERGKEQVSGTRNVRYPRLSTFSSVPQWTTPGSFEDFANGLFAERPEPGDLDYRIVLFAGQINRRRRRRTGNRVEGVGRFCWFSSGFRHGMTPTDAAC